MVSINVTSKILVNSSSCLSSLSTTSASFTILSPITLSPTSSSLLLEISGGGHFECVDGIERISNLPDKGLKQYSENYLNNPY